MSSGESFIGILLLVVIYFLYQITKQLSYLTGRRFKLKFPNWQGNKPVFKPKLKPKEEKLPN